MGTAMVLIPSFVKVQELPGCILELFIKMIDVFHRINHLTDAGEKREKMQI